MAMSIAPSFAPPRALRIWHVRDEIFVEIPGHGVDISDNTLDWDDEESAWGFYGDNPTVNGISEHLEQRFPGAVKLAYDNLGKWVHVTPKETT